MQEESCPGPSLGLGMATRGGGGGRGGGGRGNVSASFGGGRKFTRDSFPGLRDGANNLVNGGGGGAGGGFCSQGGSGAKDNSGLNPNRVRGFGQTPMNRASTPSLNDMRARQGAIVAKFMTFFKRKSSVVIEMYESCFFKEKPKWDQLADFVYKNYAQMMC